MVKLSDVLCNKSLGGSARRYLAPFRRHADALLTSVIASTALDDVTSFFLRVNISVTIKTVGGISLCDGGQLEEPEGYNYFFVIFYVLESK